MKSSALHAVITNKLLVINIDKVGVWIKFGKP